MILGIIIPKIKMIMACKKYQIIEKLDMYN